MKDKSELNLCGIYQIVNKINGNVYIGQTIDYGRRIQQHRRNLLNNTHGSKYLQNSFNKHGKEAFHFTFLEECPRDNKEYLTSREQHYIDTTRSFYNMAKIAGLPAGTAKEFKLWDLDGNFYKGKNISEFARIHNVSPIKLAKVVTGKRTFHKGFVAKKEDIEYCKRHKNRGGKMLKSPIVFYHPETKTIKEVWVLRQFAKELGVSTRKVSRVRGNEKLEVKGWFRADNEEGIMGFCKENNINLPDSELLRVKNRLSELESQYGELFKKATYSNKTI